MKQQVLIVTAASAHDGEPELEICIAENMKEARQYVKAWNRSQRDLIQIDGGYAGKAVIVSVHDGRFAFHPNVRQSSAADEIRQLRSLEVEFGRN